MPGSFNKKGAKSFAQRSLAKRSFAQRTRGAKFGVARSAAERLANVR